MIIFYITVSIVFPLLLILILYKLDKKIVILIAPMASAVAFFINEIGFGVRWWYLKQVFGVSNQNLTALPVNCFFYPALGCFLIYLIEHSHLNNILLLITFIISTTLFEYLLTFIGLLQYRNSWTLFYTAIAYLFSYGIGYLYYNWLKKLDIL